MVNDHVTDTYKFVSKLYKIALTLPITSASCERSFSALGIIKNYLRTTMNETRLNSLMMIAIEKELIESLSNDEIIDKFKEKGNRGMLL